MNIKEKGAFQGRGAAQGLGASSSQIISTLVILICFLMPIFTSCSGGSDDDDDIIGSTEYLNVTSVVSLPGDGSTSGTLDIKADCSWTITGAPSWLTLSDNSGNGNANIALTATPNPSSTDERSAALTVASTSGKIKRTVTVSQAIAAETLTLSANEISFISDGESKVLSINSNTSWRITGLEDWFTVSRDEGSGNSDITITTKRNESESARRATLTVQCTNASARVTISQEGHVTTLSVSPSVINAQSTANTYTLILEGDASWTASVNVDWCTLSKLNGVGSDKLSVSVDTNNSEKDREATITFTTSHGDKTCVVKQAGGVLPTISNFKILDVERYSFTALGSYSSEYEVTEYGVCYSLSNSEPTIADSKISQASSEKNGNISLKVEGLNSGKTYYVRIYVKSIIGITYSDVKNATTIGSTPSNDDIVKPQI